MIQNNKEQERRIKLRGTRGDNKAGEERNIRAQKGRRWEMRILQRV